MAPITATCPRQPQNSDQSGSIQRNKLGKAGGPTAFRIIAQRFLVLEATVGFNECDGAAELTEVNQRSAADFQVTSQDVKFLKSLRISVDDER